MVVTIDTFKGLVFTNVEVSPGKDEIIFTTKDGTRFLMYHDQDCCESVTLEEVIGDTSDLLNSPILEASEETNHTDPPKGDDSYTWTFYKLGTIKGHVTLRWYGESNGYYSERVSIKEMDE